MNNEIYPNPVKDALCISNTTSEDYKIFDVFGKLINSGKLQKGYCIILIYFFRILCLTAFALLSEISTT